MTERPYEFVTTAEGPVLRVRARGFSVLGDADAQPGDRVHARGAAGARAGRAAAPRGVDHRRAAPPGPRPVPAAAGRPGQERVPGQPPRPQRGPVLPAAVGAPGRHAADRLHADGRQGDRALQPRVPPSPGRVPLGGPPGPHRGVVPQLRARRRRRRPHRGHRRRGHPRHRRLGGRRDRDRHRQAGRLHRRGRDPPAPGDPGGARHGHRQPAAAQRQDVPGQPARTGPRAALRRLHRRLRDHRHQAVPARPAALGGPGSGQRPAGPAAVRRPVLHLQRRHAGHRRRGAGGGVGRGQGERDPHGRPAGGHPRRRHGRPGDRRHAARRHGGRGAVAGGGHPAVLVPGPSGADHRRPPGPTCSTSSGPTPGRRPRSPTGPAPAPARARPWPTWSPTCTRPC